MSRLVRHVIGLIIGLLVVPALVVVYGYAGDLWRNAPAVDEPPYLARYAAIAGLALLLGVLAGSRLSPLASLLPGVMAFGLGAAWVFDPSWMHRHTVGHLPHRFDLGYLWLGGNGILLLLGGVLLGASLWPSRWRSGSSAVKAVRPDPLAGFGPPPEDEVDPAGAVPGAGAAR